MDPAHLKRSTASDHERAERSMNLMNPGLTVATYVSTLRTLYGFINGWEVWAQSVSDSYLHQHVIVRQRSALLRTDLQIFSSSPPDGIYPGPKLSLANRAHVLGAMYVIEGSTLGGQYIARHVERVLNLKPNEGSAYFHGYGDQTGQMWRDFKELIQQIPDGNADAVIFAAKTVFADFTAWNSASEEAHGKG